MCVGEGLAAAPNEGEDTAAAGGGVAGSLADVPDEEQALLMAPMLNSMTMARQPHPADCFFFCDTRLPAFLHPAI